jgi:hypothetical protein
VIRPVLALGVLALAGCSSVDRNADAATVADGAVTIDDFQAVLQEIVDNPDVFNVEEDPATGTMAANTAQNVLALMIRDTASGQFLDEAGEPITDEDRQAVLDTVSEDDPVLQLSDGFVALFVDADAAGAARSRIEGPDAAERERLYTTSPAELGVVCVRHVVLSTRAEAEEVLAEIRGGGDIQAIATERSIDPTAATNGGALEDGGSACVPNQQAAQGTDPDFVAAAVTSTPGVPVGPVQTDFGWHVIEARPYEEVADSLTALYDASAGDLMFQGYLASADITVDPRYGRWNGAAATVVPLA